jgi:pimeloyl-ACP methyl ester carboxylesterase
MERKQDLMSRYILVHGAFHGGWCWDRVVDGLRAAGHTATALDLPGSGSDRTPIEGVTLEAYTKRIRTELEVAAEPAILVGHSMGGVAITQAAAESGHLIEQVVYVAAFLPRDGESLMSLAARPEGEGDGVQKNMVVAGDPPVATMPPESAASVFYGNCPPWLSEEAVLKIGAQPLAPFATPVDIDDSRLLKRRYIVCLRDQAIPPALQHVMARASNCLEVTELDTDHSPFLSAPDELTRVLIGYAG